MYGITNFKIVQIDEKEPAEFNFFSFPHKYDAGKMKGKSAS